MFDIKAIKASLSDRFQDEDPDPTHGKFRRLIYAITHYLKYEILYKIEGFFYKYKERIGRSYSFAKHGWLSYDFDAHTLFDLMAFKLKRIHKSLSNGYAYQGEEDMAALLRCIHICEKLFEGDYERKYLEEHDKKWGELEMDSKPIVSPDGKVRSYSCESTRSGTINASEEVKEQERKEFMECYPKGEVDRLSDLDELLTLFKKHLAHWWD